MFVPLATRVPSASVDVLSQAAECTVVHRADAPFAIVHIGVAAVRSDIARVVEDSLHPKPMSQNRNMGHPDLWSYSDPGPMPQTTD